MSLSSLFILTLSVSILVYIIYLYNGLVSLKHSVSKAWSNIDVLLKQRHDEIPKLIEVCKTYMNFEQDTLEKVIRARSAVMNASQKTNMAALGVAETSLRAGLGHIFALAENYPQLKTDRSFAQLQERISALENAIADRREVYNESVNNNNVRIEQVPDVFIARMFNFKDFQLLEFSESETSDISPAALFKQ